MHSRVLAFLTTGLFASAVALAQITSAEGYTPPNDDPSVKVGGTGVIQQLLTYMAEMPTLISHCLELISVSRNLERVGDLATNIAEDTIFIAEAKLVKHHGVEFAR